MYDASAYLVECTAEGVSPLSTRPIYLLLTPKKTQDTHVHIVCSGKAIKGQVSCGAVTRVVERTPAHPSLL